MPSHAPPPPRRPLWLLAAGTLAGALAAAAGLFAAGPQPSDSLPDDAAASVNGQIVSRDDYARLLSALASDKRGAVDAADRRFVLDRLVDEELLIQRGLELGLAHHDARVRKDLTMAMVESVVAEFRDLEVDSGALQDFFAANQDFFTRTGRYRVRQVWARAATLADGDAAFERARVAAERLRRGDPFEAVRAEHGDAEVAPLPDAPLPAAKLADYLGPTALRAVLELDVGGVSDPVRSSTGYHVLQLVERDGSAVPAFDDVRDQVLAEYRRREADSALRAYLADLRSRAEVELAADLVDAAEAP